MKEKLTTRKTTERKEIKKKQGKPAMKDIIFPSPVLCIARALDLQGYEVATSYRKNNKNRRNIKEIRIR